MTNTASTIVANLAIKYNQATHQTLALPLLIFFPTARCNSRCVSCDWWRADGTTDLALDEIAEVARQLPALGVRVVLFSGGEPLLRREVFEIADIFRSIDVKLHLLTSGLFLERDAEKIATRFENVTLSLDGHTAAIYRQIRGVDGLALIERGATKFKNLAPNIPLRARSTLHRHNFRELPSLIDKARTLGLDQISFLAADVTSEAFGRRSEFQAGMPSNGMHKNSEPLRSGLLLDEAEISEFAQVIESTVDSHRREFESHFVAESPAKLRRLPSYYAAQLGMGEFPPVSCNAPWVSAVIEADGSVRPCYFHNIVGNLRENSLKQILRRDMSVFRASLDVSENSICAKCVCTLKVGLRSNLW